MDELEDEFTVSLRAWQSRVYDAGNASTPLAGGLGDLVHDAALHCGVAHHPFRDVGSAGLELRLHEDERLPAGSRESQHRRQGEAHGDERHVADDERRCERELLQEAGVRALEHGHARVVPQSRVQLAVTDVERDHAGGAPLEQDIGEAAGRRSHVHAVEPARVDAECVERIRELVARPRDVWRRLGDVERLILLHLLARLVMTADEPGHHDRLRLGAALREAALDQNDVQTLLHAVRATRPATISLSTEVSAGVAARRAWARSPASSARRRASPAPTSRT